MERDTEVHMAGMVQRNAQIPAFRNLDELGSKMGAVELQGSFAESKGTAGIHQGIPAFIQRTGAVDGSLQLGDGEVRAQCVPEHSTKDHASSDVEFLISKVLDGEPDDGTERDQGDAGDVVCGGTEEERETGRNSGGGIEDITRHDAG